MKSKIMVSKVKLKDLGERKAQEVIREVIGERTIDLGDLKDDCAVVEFKDGYLLITTDMISQKTHIPANATFSQMGWHVVAINLSDIAAMGGEPLGIVLALGMPLDFEEESLQELMDGANSCALKFDTYLLGGDTKENECLTISGCAVGKVPGSEVMRRSGAKVGDIVAVTGELGGAGSAYHLLKNSIDSENAIKNLLQIYPRINEGRALAKTRTVTSCMDISDGLASSIHQLSNLNDVRFRIDFENIPVSIKAKALSENLKIPLEELTVYFGGDYELLVTIEKEKVEDAQKALARMRTKLTPIGEVIENNKNILIKDGISSSLEDRGYEHFRWKE